MDILLRGTNTIGSVGSFVATFILGFTTIILLYWYSSWKHKYWKNLGIPYVKPLPIIGSVMDIILKSLHDQEEENYKKLGRIYGRYEGNQAVLSVGDPELLRSILVKDFHVFSGRRVVKTGDKILESMLSMLQGEDWKRVRAIVTPTFTTGKIKRMMGIFKECSRTVIQNFKKAAENGEHVEAKAFYGAFTMDVIASSAFSTKIDSHNDPSNEFVLSAKSIFSQKINWRGVLYLLMPWVMKLFKITLLPSKALNFFSKVTLQIIEERKRTGQTRNDFLQLLMDTAKELQDEGKLDYPEKEHDIIANYGMEENKEIFKNVVKRALSPEELVGQCVIFFLAGYDTTASTLAFATYNLALNPDVQERLIQELDEALQENKGELTYEAIQSLKTLDNVISETLRLYPSFVRVERVAEEDYKLGDTGLTIPKGMIISIPIFAMHRDKEYFPNPEKFDPDRFTPEERAKRHQYTYLPFGLGPRSCVGMRFALVEIKVCLAHVLSNFRIKKCSRTKVPLEFNQGIGFLQPKEINVVFEIRKDAVKTP